MPIRTNAYNNPDIASLFAGAAAALAPPSAQDDAALAKAGLDVQKRQQIADLFANPNQPNFDRRNIVVGNYNPTQSFYAQDQNNATTQRGQDITANTSITNNTADNAEKFAATRFGAVAQDAMLPALPQNIGDLYGVGAQPQVNGLRSPLSETQVKGALLQQQLPTNPTQLTDAQTIALTMGTTPVENIVGGDGRPEIVLRPQAVGREPAYAPNATIMSDGLPKPPEGAVWKLGPDGKPVLDERGAPIAIPYQGGPLYQKNKDAEIGNRNTDLLHDLVLDKIDTAVSQVNDNPTLATGLGAQISGGIGGGPANDLGQTLATIKANISFDKLQALRQASPTGGALGNVSDNDMKLLQATYGSLEQSQSAPQLLQNLAAFKQLYYDTINGPGEYAKKQTADAAALASAPPLPAGVTEEDVQHTMQIHGLTREQVLARLGGT